MSAGWSLAKEPVRDPRLDELDRLIKRGKGDVRPARKAPASDQQMRAARHKQAEDAFQLINTGFVIGRECFICGRWGLCLHREPAVLAAEAFRVMQRVKELRRLSA
jgi:hypothetical protein